MNAGGHGSDMAASLVDVTIVDLAARRANERSAASELGLGFRHSELPESAVVVEARLQLAHGDRERIRAHDLRDRALAAREPARRSERRLGVRQPGAGRGERREH